MFTKLVRIGRDAQMKYLPSGTAILEMSVVYDIGYGDNKKSQWVKLAMFGARAEKLVAHFTKGKQIVATMDDVKSEAWISNGEAKSGLSAKLVDFEFAGSGNQSNQQQAPAQQQRAPQMAPAYQAPVQQQMAPQQQSPVAQPQMQQQVQSYGAKPQTQPANNSQNFDDDIPF